MPRQSNSLKRRPRGKGIGVNPHPSAHPLVKQLFAIAKQQGVSAEELSSRSGVYTSTLMIWAGLYRNGKITNPTIGNLVAAFNALGCELVVKGR
jgi:hypothetical protein